MRTVKKTTDENKITRRDIVLIYWWDAVSNAGWCGDEEISELVTKDEQQLVWSVGVVVKKDKDFYYLAADWGMDENPYNRILLIPKGMVKKVTIIRRWRK